MTRVDLDAIEQRLDAANSECGPWSIFPDLGSITIDSLEDDGDPRDGTALFLREVREDVSNLIAELRAAREARQKLIELHAAWDKAAAP